MILTTAGLLALGLLALPSSASAATCGGAPATVFDIQAYPDGKVIFSGTQANDVIDSDFYRNTDRSMRGNGGSDAICGANGDDSLDGDYVVGGGYVSPGNDALSGGAGNDFLDGGPGINALAGGSGTDALASFVLDGSGPDGVSISDGGREGDRIFGGPGGDFLVGGDDTAFDTVLGGGGNDWVISGRVVSGPTGDGLAGQDGDDAVIGGAAEDGVQGDRGNDYLDGQDSRDNVRGGPGADYMLGGAGNDLMEDGTSRDYVDGGPGYDRFYRCLDGEDDVVENVEEVINISLSQCRD